MSESGAPQPRVDGAPPESRVDHFERDIERIDGYVYSTSERLSCRLSNESHLAGRAGLCAATGVVGSSTSAAATASSPGSSARRVPPRCWGSTWPRRRSNPHGAAAQTFDQLRFETADIYALARSARTLGRRRRSPDAAPPRRPSARHRERLPRRARGRGGRTERLQPDPQGDRARLAVSRRARREELCAAKARWLVRGPVALGWWSEASSGSCRCSAPTASRVR